jgi:ABC-type antimicrobial peptide transport system permease subunit
LSRLLIVVGGGALLLAALGIYGVLAYFVRRRTAELGIRMALGAQPGRVAVLVVWQSVFPVGLGVMIGLAAAFAGQSSFATLLVVPVDITRAALAASGVVVVTALAAAAAPAWQASRIDPTRAVRVE